MRLLAYQLAFSWFAKTKPGKESQAKGWPCILEWLTLFHPTSQDFLNMTVHHLRQRRTPRELSLIVHSLLQAGVPLGLCITHWPRGCGVQMENTFRTLRRIKAGENLWWMGERGKVHSEAGDALLALPSHPPPTCSSSPFSAGCRFSRADK